MGNKKQHKQDNLVDLMVNKTIFRVHPQVKKGIEHLNTQYNNLVGEYRLVLDRDQAYVSFLKKMIELFAAGEGPYTPEQQELVETINDLVNSDYQKRADDHHTRLNPKPQESQTPEQKAVKEEPDADERDVPDNS